ncbi:MAG: AAA family ATPase [Deltaproteobacteria bacterium]|nr:AAA family ATPase [Deltaproteobacteria bacterium]
MDQHENMPRPEEVEKEISEYLSKRFGDKVKIVAATALAEEDGERRDKVGPSKKKPFNFSIKPEELTGYLNRYIVRQDRAKAVLSTKICTHYNRVARASEGSFANSPAVGGVKNNVLLLGPTGVGKTYMIRLIAKKLGVPFVKGDATKFSETGYVGGDVEDLVRDLVRESDDDLDRAQYGIIYIDEIDKIASPGNVIGLDVSRTGVQRALLKPMEETEVELKVPHDPISMMREMERMRREGDKAPRTVSTRNILFIMSGAFTELSQIIKKRVETQGIGFSAAMRKNGDDSGYLAQVRSQDLVAYGFESEFIGRIPIVATLSALSADDLFDILKNPNNPIILSKKLDFAAYGISLKFTDCALKRIAENAATENTGARGLVSAVEKALLVFEHRLPSTEIKSFVVTGEVVDDPDGALSRLLADPSDPCFQAAFDRAAQTEREWLASRFRSLQADLGEKYAVKLTPERALIAADLYAKSPGDLESIAADLKRRLDRVKTLEIRFLKDHDLDIAFDDDAANILVPGLDTENDLDACYRHLTAGLEYGLKLVKEKTGAGKFLITPKALNEPEGFIKDLLASKTPV